MKEFRETETELLIRFYRWALEDAEREVRSDYAFLKQVHSGMARVFLEYMSQFDQAKQLKILKVLVKRAHFEAMARSDDKLTDSEQQLADEYIQFQLNYSGFDQTEGLIRYWVPRRKIGLPPRTKIHPQRFAQTVITKLRPVLENQTERHGATELSFESVGPKWKVKTLVQTDRPPSYLQIISADWRPVIRTGITTWLGIGGFAWDLLYDDQSAAAADTIANLCAHLMNAIPQLVEGLDFDSADLLPAGRSHE